MTLWWAMGDRVFRPIFLYLNKNIQQFSLNYHKLLYQIGIKQSCPLFVSNFLESRFLVFVVMKCLALNHATVKWDSFQTNSYQPGYQQKPRD